MRSQMPIIRHVPHVSDQPALRSADPNHPYHAHTTSMLYKVQHWQKLRSKQRFYHGQKSRSCNVIPPCRLFPGPYYIYFSNQQRKFCYMAGLIRDMRYMPDDGHLAAHKFL